MGFFDSLKGIINAVKGERDSGDDILMEEVQNELNGRNSPPERQRPEISAEMQEAMRRQRYADEIAKNGQKGKTDYLLESASFIMVVEDVFSITGRGVVATGKVTKGSVCVGDSVKIVEIKLVGDHTEPVLKDSTITAIEQFRKMCDIANEGDNVGIFLSGVAKNEVRRGFMIMKVN